MPRLREMIDLRWSDSGDFVMDSVEKDLGDTKKENYQGAIQKVDTRLNSSKGDWANAPEVGASLIRFAGRPNSPETGEEMRQVIINELTRGNFLSPNEIQVEVFPISENTMAAMIFITPVGQRETITRVISYNLNDNKLSQRN